jgi:hypothetical protein
LKNIYIASLVLFINAKLFAQEPVKISNGDHTVAINAIVSSYMDIRNYPSGATPKYTKNTFALKDARFGVEGKVGDKYEYKVMIDLGGIAANDPTSPALYDAYFTYKGLKKIANITIGYGKVPYSFSSLIEHEWSPYWSRAIVSKGDLFSRRDLGVKLKRSFWKDRITAYAGVYTGVGEITLANGANDPSGSYEYIGRLEVSYPDKMPKSFVDTKVRTTPNFALGLNTRYSKRNLPTGTTFLPGEVGALLSDTTLNFKVVNGEKLVYGADFSVEYMGFSFQAEGHLIKGTPQNSNDPLLMGLPKTLTKGYFKAGGWYLQANYFAKSIKTIFSTRYDQVNANDLVAGDTRHIAAAVCYQLSGYHSMIRAEYFRNYSQTESINMTKWDNEWRIGWQLMIQ